MEQRISLITLGVADLGRALTFYEKVLGWKAVPGSEGVAFFDLNGVVLSLFPHADLAQDIGIPGDHPPGYQGFSLAYNVRSEREVDELFADLGRKGATITKNPQKAFWGGYTGYFADPDGHQWEVAYNPYWTVDREGRVSMERS